MLKLAPQMNEPLASKISFLQTDISYEAKSKEILIAKRCLDFSVLRSSKNHKPQGNTSKQTKDLSYL